MKKTTRAAYHIYTYVYVCIIRIYGPVLKKGDRVKILESGGFFKKKSKKLVLAYIKTIKSYPGIKVFFFFFKLFFWT